MTSLCTAVRLEIFHREIWRLGVVRGFGGSRAFGAKSAVRDGENATTLPARRRQREPKIHARTTPDLPISL
jgi:hypothetical protein